MTTISASEVNKLRQITGAGMMDCKKALVESNGDFEIAIDYLRKKGQKISANRADRSANEGAVIAITNSQNSVGIILELNCETDFVAKNDDFIAFANAIAQTALTHKPANIDALLTFEVEGAILADKLQEYVAKIGEKISIGRYQLVEDINVVAYIHSGNRIGVLVTLNHENTEANNIAAKDVAMQIAAMNPVAVNKEQVDASIVNREIEIGKEQARAEGKPEAMLEKIALGKLNKFYQENTLLNQLFVKDASANVAQMLNSVEKDLTVNSFYRVALGQ